MTARRDPADPRWADVPIVLTAALRDWVVRLARMIRLIARPR